MEEIAPSSTGQRYAVVTGGNKGIGFEICRQLASNGIFVILTARNEKRGTDAVDKLKASGLPDVVYHQLDVKDRSSMASLANFVSTHLKKLDILVNNAADIGLQIDGDALKALPDTFENVRDKNPELLTAIMKETYENAEECLMTNYYGTKAVTEALLPFLQLSNTANIVNVSSVYGLLKVIIDLKHPLNPVVSDSFGHILLLLQHIPNENVRSELNNVESLTEGRLNELLQCFLKDFKEGKVQANGWPDRVSAYKISKAAVNAYTRILARRFPSIRINCVNPGFVKTDLAYNLGLSTPEEGAKGPVKAALLPSNGPSGHYFDEMNVSTF